MTNVLIGIAVAAVAWFIGAGALFFNPVVDKVYRTEDEHVAVRILPQNPKTLAIIMAAVVAQCVVWAVVYVWVAPALGDDPIQRGIYFGLMIIMMKVIPRDIDRLLLTTYPNKRMTIEFINGAILAFAVSFSFAYLIG